jgi:hypothetical protein
MVVVPDAMVVAKPLPSIAATDELEEVQVTCVVMSWVVPSEYMPKAVSCSVISAGSSELAGVIDMAIRLAVEPADAELDSPESVPVPPPQLIEIRKGTIRSRRYNSFAFITHLPWVICYLYW